MFNIGNHLGSQGKRLRGFSAISLGVQAAITAVLLGSCAGKGAWHHAAATSTPNYFATATPAPITNWAVRDIGKRGVPELDADETRTIRVIARAVGVRRASLLRFAFPDYGFIVYDGTFRNADGRDAADFSPFTIILNNCTEEIMYWPAQNRTGTIPHEDQTDKQFLHSWKCPGF
jgi:hypothetical protein